MPLYHYRAINSQGKYHTGDWFGPSKDQLYQHLKDHKLQLLTYQLTKKKFLSLFYEKVQKDDLIEFCLHLYQLDLVKIPLSESILLFSQTCRGKYFKSVLLTIHDSLQQGLLFSQACKLYPSIFDTIFIESIAIAEKTGEFGTAFKNIEIYLLEQNARQQQFKQAIRYPLILFGGLIVLLGLMGGILLPQFQEQLKEMGAQSSSFASRSLTYIFSFLTNYGLPFLISFSIFVCLIVLLYKTSKNAKTVLDQFFFKIPFIGVFRKRTLFNKFIKTLSILLNAKIDLLKSLEKSKDCHPNQTVRKDYFKIYQDVQKGLKLSQALQNYKFISPVALRYIQLGEETGNLGPLLQKVTDLQTKQINQSVQTLLAWLEPSLIVIMGCLLIWVVMATILPIYDSLSIFEG